MQLSNRCCSFFKCDMRHFINCDMRHFINRDMRLFTNCNMSHFTNWIYSVLKPTFLNVSLNLKIFTEKFLYSNTKNCYMYSKTPHEQILEKAGFIMQIKYVRITAVSCPSYRNCFFVMVCSLTLFHTECIRGKMPTSRFFMINLFRRTLFSSN